MKLIILSILFISQSIYSVETDTVEFIHWYTQKKELYTSSKKYINRLQRKLINNEIIGLELIIADAADQRVESKFGHALFRFVDNDSDPGNDITISFVADVNGPKASNIAGVIGKYGVYPEVKSLRLFIKQYVKNQSRPLERHIIPSNKDMHVALIETLNSWWNEIHDARKEIYEESVAVAKEKALKKGNNLYGRDGFELFEIKFYDDEFKEDLIQSFGIIEKEETPFSNDIDKDQALYRQAYTRAYNEINLESDQIALNLFHEIWKVQQSNDIIEIVESDTNIAIAFAQNHFLTQEVKLFKKFDKNLKGNSYYAMTLETMKELDILKKAEIEMTIKTLEVSSAASEVLGKYTFFSNNCAGAVIKFLKKSNFPHKRTVGIQGRVPVKLNKWMSRSLLVPYPSIQVDGAKLLEKKVARILGFSEKEYLKYKFPIHQWEIISKYISNTDKFLFYDLYNNRITQEYALLIRKELEDLPAPDYNRVYKLETTESILYKLCSSQKCATQVLKTLNNSWSTKEIKKVKKQVNRTANNTFIYEGLTKNHDILKHLKFLNYLPSDFE